MTDNASSTAGLAELLLAIAAAAVWEADDYERETERPFDLGQPSLENDLPVPEDGGRGDRPGHPGGHKRQVQ